MSNGGRLKRVKTKTSTKKSATKPHAKAASGRSRAKVKARSSADRRSASVSRDQTKQETRDALVSAALALFAEEGLDAPSLDAICDRAGFTRGAFYVHFADRDELLVAVMEKVGEAFLQSVFSLANTPPPSTSNGVSKEGSEGHASARPPSVLAMSAHRFIAAIEAGTYPLMPPRTATSVPTAAGPRHPQVRPHQLLDACARSPVVRARYSSLVEASIGYVEQLTRRDQATGAIRSDIDAHQAGTMLLALVIGAQTMAELGVAVEPANLARAILGLLEPPT